MFFIGFKRLLGVRLTDVTREVFPVDSSMIGKGPTTSPSLLTLINSGNRQQPLQTETGVGGEGYKILGDQTDNEELSCLKLY